MQAGKDTIKYSEREPESEDNPRRCFDEGGERI